MTEHLFVYGTLRAGAHPMHDMHDMHAVLAGSAELVGRARARGLLFDLGWYPGLVETRDDRWVVGELWRLRRVSILQRLDEYEGDEYERRRRPVSFELGSNIEAWIYVFIGSTSRRRLIEHGDWLTDH